jgi:general secretion pathway protein F
MTRFQFKAYNGQGRIEAGVIEARSMADALALLNARNLLPFETEETKSPSTAGTSTKLGQALSPSDYASFMRELAVLLQAELPVDQCLRLLAGQQQNRAMQIFSDHVLKAVVAGATLSNALEAYAIGCPPVVPNLVRAGEARGNLAATLTDISRYLETGVEIRAKIRSALTYPLVLAVVALGAIGIIIGGLVPTLLPLFNENGAQAPTLLLWADSLTKFVSHNWIACASVLVSSVAGLRLAIRTKSARRFLDSAVFRVPFFGPLTRDANTAIFARTLGTLLRNGVPLIAALHISSDALTNSVFNGAVRAATQDVQEGSTLARSLRSAGGLSDMALRFIEVGEESSRLDQMLLHLADMTEKETQRRIDHGMTLLGPAMTIIIGGVIGTLVLSVMQAVMSVNALVLR